MKRKEVKETIKFCIEIYTNLQNKSKSDLQKEFYAGLSSRIPAPNAIIASTISGNSFLA